MLSLNGPSRVLLTLSLLLAAGATLVRGGDDPLRRQVLALNRITGTEPFKAQYKALFADQEATKRLITTALSMSKAKDQPLRYNAALILAQVAGDMKDLKSAETFYRLCTGEAVKLQSTKKLLESYVGLIDLFDSNKKYEESARVCRELIELRTDDDKPRIVLRPERRRFGEIEFEEDDGFDAARRLRAGVYRLLIQAIAKQGKFDQALNLSEKLIKDRDHWMERQLKAWVLNEAGKFAESAEAYEDVLKRIAKDKDLEDDERELYSRRYRSLLSNVYVENKQIDKATEHLKALVEKYPDYPGHYNDLGYIWADHDMHLEESERLIRKALELDRKQRLANADLTEEEKKQENGAYLDSMGWVLFKQKKYKEAKEYLLKAVEDKTAQHIEIYDHLGDVHLILGEREAARAAWQKGLEVAGEDRREQTRKASVQKKLEQLGK